ncbi:MAG: peptidoglycan bridge formation glycyltransferase FemA/FemB family protein [Chloroflexi bacterium]|nr:peptidoglycan bridge formation glycyltransferase FemA/FemB family protein [Chloroflexota bacterium]
MATEEAWDGVIAGMPQGHFLQGYRWGEFKRRFGWQVRRVVAEGGGKRGAVQLLIHPTPLGAIGYVPRGPAVDPAHKELISGLVEWLHSRAREAGCFYLKLEPNALDATAFLEMGFRPSPQSLQPKATIVVDLTADLETIAARQKPKTRYNIRLAARKGVAVEKATMSDLPTFYQLLQETSRRDGFFIRSEDYYRQALEVMGDKMKLLLATNQEELLAGIVVARFGEEAIYLYGASSNSHRHLMPNYLLQWQAIMWAKETGCRRYDLWGIPETAGPEKDEAQELPDQPGMWGVYRFKKGFGGEIVRYAGALDYVYSPWRYWLWTTLIPRWQRLWGRMAMTD